MGTTPSQEYQYAWPAGTGWAGSCHCCTEAVCLGGFQADLSLCCCCSEGNLARPSLFQPAASYTWELWWGSVLPCSSAPWLLFCCCSFPFPLDKTKAESHHKILCHCLLCCQKPQSCHCIKFLIVPHSKPANSSCIFYKDMPGNHGGISLIFPRPKLVSLGNFLNTANNIRRPWTASLPKSYVLTPKDLLLVGEAAFWPPSLICLLCQEVTQLEFVGGSLNPHTDMATLGKSPCLLQSTHLYSSFIQIEDSRSDQTNAQLL